MDGPRVRAWAMFLATATVLAAGCSGSSSTKTSKSATTRTTTASTTLPSTTTAPPNQVGQQFSNLGINLTVTEATSADSIRLNRSNFRPGSGYETYTDTPAGPGAKYVIVKVHIINNAKTSLDLTCSLPIKTVLIDDMQRNFVPIQALYKVQGNPECNSRLQPGFESDMTWPYRVPTATHVRSWAFEDATDPSTVGRNRPTIVRIQVPRT